MTDVLLYVILVPVIIIINGGLMLPGELIIFMAIAESGQLEKQINAPMPITGEYMNYLYNSMVKHGYLTGNSYEGYQHKY